MTDFLSVENMKSIIGLLKTFFISKYGIDIENTDIRLKPIFLNIMKRVDEDRSNKYMSTMEKTKLTLRIVKEIVKKELNLHVNRDDELYPDRDVVINNLKTESVEFSTNDDVANQMKLLEESRKLDTSVAPDIDESLKPIEDSIIDESEFVLKMKELETNRLKFNENLKVSQPVDTSNRIVEHTKENSERFIPTEESIDKTFNDENSSNTFNNSATTMTTSIMGNTTDRSVVNKPIHETDPKAFYMQDFKLANDDNKSNITQHDLKSSPVLMVPDAKISADTSHVKKIKVSKYILINSYDRNWVVDKYRYKYSVRFQENKRQTNRVAYYANNKTVPFTKTDTYEGVPNTNGWIDKNGTVHGPYDNTLESGELLGYEEFSISIDQDASISNHLKDIYSISVTNVTIPSELFHILNNSLNINSSRSTNDFNYNYSFPYILCNIEEFSDLYDGTDTTIRQSFCQLQYHDFMKTPSGRGYIILKPVQNEKKIFYPTPLATLPTLHISLTKPNGELLNNSIDGVEVFSIDVSQLYYLKITTSKYFNKDSFCKGDYIRLREFTIFKLLNLKPDSENVPSMGTDDEIKRLIDFINKKEGHVIYDIGSPNDDGYYNGFYIYAPGFFDDEIGSFVVDVGLTNTLTTFNEYIKEEDYEHTNIKANFKYGYILNMSLQNSISLTVEVFKHDASVINTVNVTKTLN
jgi:hypothetical protein